MRFSARSLCRTVSAVIALVLFAGCGQYALKSTWKTSGIVIDGIDSEGEWEHARYFLEDEKCIVGIVNDGEAISLRLSSIDPQASQMAIMGGLNVCFDPKGGKKKSFIIQLAPSMQGNRAGAERPRNREDPGQRKEPAPAEGEERQKRDSPPDRMPTNMTMLVNIKYGEKDKGVAMTVDQAREHGIFVSAGMKGRTFILEMRVPFARSADNPYGISEKDVGGIIGVGFISGTVRTGGARGGRSGGQGGRSGGMGGGRSGGMGGGGMGGRGGTGGGRGGGASMQPVMPDPIELWLKVKLASQEE